MVKTALALSVSEMTGQLSCLGACVVLRSTASFVSRAETTLYSLAFSAHLLLLFLCAGGSIYNNST